MIFNKDQFPQKTTEEEEKEEEEDKLAINMADFRKEIAELKAKKINKEIEGTLEILNVDPDDLTEEDAYFWNKLNNKPDLITEGNLDRYKKDVEDSKNISREYFSALIIQKITVLWLNKQTQERMNKKNY